MNCSDIKPNLEAYALGALDSYHAARVEKHIKSCAACSRTLASFREVVSELPHALSSAAPLKPPDRLKDRLLSAVAAEERERNKTLTKQETSATRPITPAPRGQRVGWLPGPRAMLFALTTAGLVIAALLFSVAFTNLKLQQALESRFGASQEPVPSRQVLNSVEDPRSLFLFATDPSSDAYGKLIFDANKLDVVFIAYNLPPPGLSRRYILWTRNKGYMQRVAEFTPDAKGMAVANFKLDHELVLKEVYVTEQLASYPLPAETKILRWVSDKTNDY